MTLDAASLEGHTNQINLPGLGLLQLEAYPNLTAKETLLKLHAIHDASFKDVFRVSLGSQPQSV